MTRITSATAISSVSSTSLTACRIEMERSIKTLISTGGVSGAQCRNFKQQGIDHRDGAGIRLLLNAGTMNVQCSASSRSCHFPRCRDPRLRRA